MKKSITIITGLIFILFIGIFLKLAIDYKSKSDINKLSQITKEESQQPTNNNENNSEENKPELGGDENDESEIEAENVNYLTLDVNEVRVPILMYHSVSDSDTNNSLLVPVSQFEEQVKWLKESGFTPMLLEDVVQAFETGKVPQKPVAITFDDGYSDNYTDAYRILKQYNMKATFFIITNGIDDGYYMSSNMLKEMSQNGMEIENHTSRHIEFTTISREDKIAIIKEGIEALKQKVGVDSEFVCYPVGRYDEETIEVEKELGIKAAVTTEGGISSLADGVYSLSRIRISPMDIETFKSIFSEFLK